MRSESMERARREWTMVYAFEFRDQRFTAASVSPNGVAMVIAVVGFLRHHVPEIGLRMLDPRKHLRGQKSRSPHNFMHLKMQRHTLVTHKKYKNTTKKQKLCVKQSTYKKKRVIFNMR